VKIIAQTIDVSNRDTLRDFIDGLRGKVRARRHSARLGRRRQSRPDGGREARISWPAASSASGLRPRGRQDRRGGGGGRPDLAEAGGKSPEKLPEALAEGRCATTGRSSALNTRYASPRQVARPGRAWRAEAGPRMRMIGPKRVPTHLTQSQRGRAA